MLGMSLKHKPNDKQSSSQVWNSYCCNGKKCQLISIPDSCRIDLDAKSKPIAQSITSLV
jgi:hypothetical protein